MYYLVQMVYILVSQIVYSFHIQLFPVRIADGSVSINRICDPLGIIALSLDVSLFIILPALGGLIRSASVSKAQKPSTYAQLRKWVASRRGILP